MTLLRVIAVVAAVWLAISIVVGLVLGKRLKAADLCACGHTAEAHQHYRPGRDCSLCACLAPSGRLRPV